MNIMIGVVSFVAGVLADHFIETKIRASIAHVLTKASADVAPTQSNPPGK